MNNSTENSITGTVVTSREIQKEGLISNEASLICRIYRGGRMTSVGVNIDYQKRTTSDRVMSR